MTANATTQTQPLVIAAMAILAKRFSGHDVRSEPEEGDEGGDAGELVPGRELRFTDIVLTDEWIEALLGRGATALLFTTLPDKPRQRAFDTFSTIPLDTKYKNCDVSITFGLQKKNVRLERATVKNMRLKFTKTNDLALSFTAVGVRPNTIEMLELEEFGGHPVDLVVTFGAVIDDAVSQQELPLQQQAISEEQNEAKDDEEQRRYIEAQRQYSEALRGLEGQQKADAA